MKKILIAVVSIVLISFIASSCVTGNKMGCPTNVGSSKPFRS